jgi:hypothetical protein
MNASNFPETYFKVTLWCITKVFSEEYNLGYYSNVIVGCGLGLTQDSALTDLSGQEDVFKLIKASGHSNAKDISILNEDEKFILEDNAFVLRLSWETRELK